MILQVGMSFSRSPPSAFMLVFDVYFICVPYQHVVVFPQGMVWVFRVMVMVRPFRPELAASGPTLIRTYHPGASSRPQFGPQNFP